MVPSIIDVWGYDREFWDIEMGMVPSIIDVWGYDREFWDIGMGMVPSIISYRLRKLYIYGYMQ